MSAGTMEQCRDITPNADKSQIFVYSFARDVATSLVVDYSNLVWQLTSPNLSAMSAEFAYGRLLGVRGSLCRICPASYHDLLEDDTVHTWRTAERHLYDFFNGESKNEILIGVAKAVEERWTTCVEAFLALMSAKVVSGEVRDQIGLLRGIDSIALHLAQRELFRWSEYFNVSTGNAQAVKLRIRLFSLFLATQRMDFGSSYVAIRSYRETFGILDRQAYPWWFVDTDLTERQMNWTYRRLKIENLGWRF
jgi:hypothetical protein